MVPWKAIDVCMLVHWEHHGMLVKSPPPPPPRIGRVTCKTPAHMLTYMHVSHAKLRCPATDMQVKLA